MRGANSDVPPRRGRLLGPVLGDESGHLAEVAEVTGKERGPVGEADAGDAEVHGRDPDMLPTELLKAALGGGVKRQDLKIPVIALDHQQVAVRLQDVRRLARPVEVRSPSQYLLLEVNNGRAD